MRGFIVVATVWVGLALPAVAGAAPIAIGGPTTAWNPVAFGSIADWADDEDTGQAEADIVGDASHPAFYTAFDDAGTAALTDGILGFRVRLGAEANPPGFNKIAGVGIDANLDGALDVFVMVNNSQNPNSIGIFNAAAGATTPGGTTITSTGVSYAQTPGVNYDWSAVTVSIDPSATILDLDGDGSVDRFLSFAVPLQDLVNRLSAIGITNVTQDTPFQYVIGTSTNANSLNQDIGGPNGGTTSSSTWAVLGATSLVYSPAGTPVPEPGTALLMGLGLFGLGWSSRRRP